ncbi:MAG: autotransporter domain-containing protein [Chthoniobacter sp.]|nr:autotransporter domain-containing protein [Chthoniobacter sp.]
MGANPNGSQVLLVDSGSGGPIAANVVFNNDWTLTSIPGKTIPGFLYPYAPLTLTQGGVTVNGNALATIDAIINVGGGTGTLTKMGTGDLILTQTVKGNVNVQDGGLGGNFMVTGNLLNNAFLAGGKSGSNNVKGFLVSPGTIKVGGDFTQTSNGTLFVPIAGDNSNSQLIVTGKANLAGKASAVFLGGFTPKTGSKFTIITADGGVSGQFNTVDSPFGGPLLFANYSKNAVVLTSGGVFGTPPPGITYTGNQQAVANNLDLVAGDPRYTNVFNYISGQGPNNLTHNLDRIAPEEMTSMHSVGAATSQVHSNNIQGRTSIIRGGGLFGSNDSSGFSAQGLAINGDGPGYNGPVAFRTGAAGPRGDDGKESKEVKQVAPVEDRWGAFLSGTGEWVSVGNSENARGYDLASGGFTLGVDYKLCPNFAIGLMAGYTGTGVDLVDNGRTWINGGKIGLYATTFAGGWYADTAVTGGYNSYDSRRSALGGDARSSTEGGDLNVLLGTGYDIKRGAFTFGPTASFNYTYTGVDGFTEHGSLVPLKVNGSHTESERMALGIKASYDWKLGSVIVRPEVRVAYQHEFGDVSTSIASSFAAGGGGTFDAVGPEIGRDSLLLGAGFAVQCTSRCTTFVYYDGELGRSNYSSNAVTGGIRVAF